MTSNIKPMLAGTVEDVAQVKYPVIASPKLDGIRCLIIDGKPVSRKLKDIPNKYIQKKLSNLPEGMFDGELITTYGAPIWDAKSFNEIQSEVMSEEGEPNFVYVIFDMILDTPYVDRVKHMETLLKSADRNIEVIKSVMITNVQELLELESRYRREKYEGVMLRSIDGPYKFGRSTVNEGYLLKLKRFKDDEGIIIGFEERMHNGNDAEIDALGHTKRSHKKSGLLPTETLGAFTIQWQGHEFKIGTGMDDALRQLVWDNRDKFIGKLVTFKYQELSQYGIPRFPVFKGFRDERDK